jgi:hypothetical protein
MKIRYKAALGLTSLNPDSKVTRAEVISAAMLASGNFPAATMPISYAVLGNSITNLHTAIVASANGVPGSTSHMHEQERVLLTAFILCVLLLNRLRIPMPIQKQLLNPQA